MWPGEYWPRKERGVNSCLYRSVVAHRRTAPKRHAFKYRIFMCYLDLDELDELDSRFRLFGRNRFAPYEFRDSDHYQLDGLTLREGIERYARENGIEPPIGSIRLLTHLRTWGHVFNPVSFYFLFGTEGEPLGSIAEVGNTFNEQKLYLLPANGNGASNGSRAKRFYVSPFSDLDTTFHFRLSPPGDRLRLAIDQSQASSVYFRSAISGMRSEFSDTRLLGYLIRFPAITVSILFAIHWQAFLLYLKGIRARRKADNEHLQTEVRPRFVPPKHSIH